MNNQIQADLTSSGLSEAADGASQEGDVFAVGILCFSQKLDLGASASVAKSLFHWLRGRFMTLKRMLRIQFL